MVPWHHHVIRCIMWDFFFCYKGSATKKPPKKMQPRGSKRFTTKYKYSYNKKSLKLETKKKQKKNWPTYYPSLAWLLRTKYQAAWSITVQPPILMSKSFELPHTSKTIIVLLTLAFYYSLQFYWYLYNFVGTKSHRLAWSVLDGGWVGERNITTISFAIAWRKLQQLRETQKQV